MTLAVARKGTGHAIAPPRHDLSEFCAFMALRYWRAQGKPGTSNAPAAPRAEIESTRISHHRFTGHLRPSLREWFYGFLRALPGDRALLAPSFRESRACSELDVGVGTSGPHDFAVRELRIRLVRSSRPSHPALNVRDDREAPLFIGCETRGNLPVICATRQVAASATH